MTTEDLTTNPLLSPDHLVPTLMDQVAQQAQEIGLLRAMVRQAEAMLDQSQREIARLGEMIMELKTPSLDLDKEKV